MAEEQVSAVILAGGYSTRMGRNKAELDFHGVSFLAHQVNKLRSLGIRDIVVSGYPAPVDGTRYVPDVYPHRGPLSGIHAGLLAIENQRALVLAVDTPLIPAGLLRQLMERRRGDVTLAAFRGEPEPLIGVYDKALCPVCEDILRGAHTSVRRLLQKADCSFIEYTGEAVLLMNCNTPEDYEKLCAYSPAPPVGRTERGDDPNEGSEGTR